MTKAEVERYLEGAVWRMKQQAQLDYTLANLIGISTARVFSKDAQFPDIQKVYPYLFEEELIEQQQEDIKTTNSINNFMTFARQHNAKIKGGQEDKLCQKSY